MKKLLNVYKPKGKTPLEIIHQLKKQFPEYKNEPIGYAGRLDPLAHGVLLLMVGEETTKQKDTYLNLSKTYEFEVVFGMSTDTYDTLGLIKPYSSSEQSESRSSRQARTINLIKKIKTFIDSKPGKQTQSYPPYSSKTVAGKPLFWWAKNNKLSEIEIPTREIEIYNFELLQINAISTNDLQKEIYKQIDSVVGDFRQKEIKKEWEDFFENKIPKQVRDDKFYFQTARFVVSCSSGTYIRSLVDELGEAVGTGAITLEIFRTKVGEYDTENSLHLEL